MTTVATLGERALRRLGVAIVPVADRPALTVTIPAATIATNALRWLAVIASEETAGVEDQAYALTKVTAVHDTLVAQGFVSWVLAGIPQAVSEEYTLLTAMHCAPSFGKQADPAQLPVIEARVRKVAMLMGAPDLSVDAVMAVHKHLAATGEARWSSFDVPDGAEQVYVVLAANLLAPAFGQQPDAQAAVMAMRALAQITALPTSGERTMAEYF